MTGENTSLHVAKKALLRPGVFHMIYQKTASDPVIKALLRKLLNPASCCCDPGNNVSLYAQTEAADSNSTACAEGS